jgi:CheY-like chemotaxis protein
MMSRVLLVDDSPHAQRMGERILSEEGYEVVTVSNAESALVRLEDVDPDVVIADIVMPGRTGYEVCNYIRMSPRHRHVRVILTVGILEPFDEAQTKRAEADSVLKKPFEASALLKAVKPLAEAAAAARAGKSSDEAKGAVSGPRPSAAPFVAVVDPEQLRAAVTLALDSAMESMIDEITARVTESLRTRKPAPEAESKPARQFAAQMAEAPKSEAPPAKPAETEPLAAAPPPPAEVIRRVNPLRPRAGSILGLNLGPVERAPEKSIEPGPRP